MTPEDFIARWLSLADDHAAQCALFAAHPALLTDDLFHQMKQLASEARYVNPARAEALIQSMLAGAEISHSPLHRGWALMTRADILRERGQGEAALVLYREAQRLCEEAGNPVQAARTAIGIVAALFLLTRYEEALALADATRPTFEAHGEWLFAASLDSNAAVASRLLGDYPRALTLYDRARDAFLRAGARARTGNHLFTLELQRGIVLRLLDRYDEAIASATKAQELARELKLPICVARAERSLGQSYVLLGDYNRALASFHDASEHFRQENLPLDMMVTDLFQAECLLALNEWERALDLAQGVAQRAPEMSVWLEAALGRLYASRALRGLNRIAAAVAELDEARRFFEQAGNPSWLAAVDLERALLARHRGDWSTAWQAAASAAGAYAALGLPVEQAEATLVLAQVSERQGATTRAELLYTEVWQCGEAQALRRLIAEARAGLARLAAQADRPADALDHLHHALDAFDHLRDRLAFDLRISFIADKLDTYALGVRLALAQGDIDGAFALVERAKSRALVELFESQPQWRLRPRNERDRALVEEIERLRQEQRWFQQRARAGPSPGETEPPTEAQRATARAAAQEREKRLTELLLRLQVRDARYSEDEALLRVQTSTPAPFLAPGTLLLEYVALGDDLWLFTITREGTAATRLAHPLAQIGRLLASLRLNLGRVPLAAPTELAILGANCRALLGRLYDALLAPAGAALDRATRLFIVPHDRLHYLPFHALWDGSHHLVERLPVTYLPAASLFPALHRRRSIRPATSRAAPLVLGYSDSGVLPLALSEAEAVSRCLDGHLLLEEEATCTALSVRGTASPIIHIAAHGEFRADAPLFSNIHLADGPLSAVDILGHEWNAELVTLSACESGLGSVRSGDELIGLSRACFHAGASALLLSLWRVEDGSTAWLMDAFYSALLGGASKAEALRAAQCTLLATPQQAHPFFWAPFFLMGDGHEPLAHQPTRAP